MDLNISLNDFRLFEELAAVRSIRELARRRRTQPGQISKGIKKLEQRLGFKLIDRSIAGVVLTREGNHFLEFVQQINSDFDTFSAKKTKATVAPISIVATSFMNHHLVIPAVTKITEEQPNIQIVDAQPDEIQWIGLRGMSDATVHIGRKDWPKTWKSLEIGKMRWVLCARKNHKLHERATPTDVARYPFVIPTYWSPEGLRAGNDQCPMKISDRIIGYQASTAESALALIAKSDQVAFVPEIIMPPFSHRTDIKIVHVPAWPEVTRSVYLSIRTDRLRKSFFDQLQESLRDRLSLSSFLA